MALRTSNPALRTGVFTNFQTTATESMSLNGTVDKTFLLLVATVAAAASSWGLLTQRSPLVFPLMIGGVLTAFILSFVIIFKPSSAPVLAPIYAIGEGFMLGGISAVLEMRYSGVAVQAVGCTFGTLFCMLAAYRSGMIRATEKFKLGMAAAMGGLVLYLLVSLVFRLVFHTVSLGMSASPIGILFSVAVVILAALNLVLDFDFIEQGVAAQAPRYMEWYAAYSILLTLIWLYLEFLRLLSKLQSRD